MPMLYPRLRRHHVQSSSPWANRPEPCRGEIRSPDQITEGMCLNLEHRRYPIAAGFTAKTAMVVKGPYAGERGRLMIEIEYLDEAHTADLPTTLVLSTYGVVEYDGGGWSQGHYLAMATATLNAQVSA